MSTHASAAGRDTAVVVRRIMQYLVDQTITAVIISPFGLTILLLSKHGDDSAREPLWMLIGLICWALVSLMLVAWYWVLRPARTGQTWGMALFGVRVERIDGKPMNKTTALLRWLFLLVDGLCAGLVGLAVILLSRDRQRVGDMVARTTVVRAR